MADPNIFGSVILDSVSTDPSSSEDGEMWYNSSQSRFKRKRGGAIKESADTDDVTDRAVAVSGNDTTPGSIEAKVVAGTAVSLATLNEGADETRQISVSFGATGSTACVGNDSRLSDNRTDSNAIHKATSGEIAGMTEKGTPVGADLIVIEDSAASNAKKKVQISNLPSSSSDTNAIHKNAANEISTITEKTTMADADLFILEDSAASGVKKKVQFANLKGTASAAGAKDNIQFRGSQAGSFASDDLFKWDAVGHYLIVGPTNPSLNGILEYLEKNLNTYIQVCLTNVSGAPQASTDVCVGNDLSTDLNYYGDFGINSSGNTDPAYPLLLTNDVYLYCMDGQFVLGTGTANKDVVFHSGGFALANERLRITGAGSVDISSAFSLRGAITPTSIGANQNNYDPTGLSTATFLRLSSSGSYNITGLAGGTSGRVVIIHNIGANNLTLKDESASSTAANRFALPSTDDFVLWPDQTVILHYDATTTRWRVIGCSRTPYGNQANTICQGNDSRLSDSRAPTGTASGDLADTYPSPTVAKASKSFALTGGIAPASIGADQNDYSPTGLADATSIRLTASGAYNITGLAGGVGGRMMILHNASAFKLTIVNESSASTAANRFLHTSAQNLVLNPDQNCELQYCGVCSRWRVTGASRAPYGTTVDSICQGNDSRLSDARTPTSHASSHNAGGGDALAIDAAAGTGSLRTLGTAATAACAGNDSRLSDSRTPTSHASSHNAGGGDALAIDAAAGTGSLRTLGTGATAACAGNDSRLSDSRAPTSHATSHKSAGGDSIKLDELAAPTDVTTLNATTGQHGLLPKLGGGTANFLRADGAWAAPSSSGVVPSEATATGTTTTTSATDVQMDSMTLTPGAGTYLVMFSTSAAHSDAAGALYVSIYANSVQVAASERRRTAADLKQIGMVVPLATQAVVTVSAAQVIEVKWRTSVATATAYQRTMTLLKIG